MQPPQPTSADSTSMTGMNWIDGQWVEGRGNDWIRNAPSDDRPVWQGNWASVEQTQHAVAAARNAFPDWAEVSLEDRIQLCKRFADIVTERKEELARLIALENGKPLWEARTESAAAIAKVANSVEAILARRWTTTEQLGDFLAVTRFRPHGVMLVIGPFNFPAHVPGGHIIPALLAGNTLVFKPSEMVPATGQWLTKVWQEAGIPPGVLNLVHGAAEVAATACENQDVDGILFTGSQRVGTILHRTLAGQPHRVLALEMGGNNPLVLHNTNDYRAAAITIILSAFITSGQRCTCTRRLIVSGDEAYERVVDELVQLIPKIRWGLSLDESQPFMGPLIDAKAAEAMLDAQREFLAAGSTALVEMQSDDRSAALLTPGLLAMGDGQIVADCEHFGPLLRMQKADDLEHAIALANDTKFGLSAGFIGDEVEDFHYFLHRTRAGIVNWNRQTTGASGKLPFGGVGMSGNHHPSGFFAADYCSYPVASLESHMLSEARKPVPGLEFGDDVD